MQISSQEIIKQFAAESQDLRDTLEELRREWKPDEPPEYLVMARFAALLSKQMPFDQVTVSHLLELTESFAQTDSEAANLVTVGFLESLLTQASHGMLDFHEILPLLGPKSLEYCEAWDEFTGCDVVSEAKRAHRQG